MTIALANILGIICPLRTLEIAFQSITISNFLGQHDPHAPNGSRLRLWRDSSVIEKYPNFTYSIGWTVWNLYRKNVSFPQKFYSHERPTGKEEGRGYLKFLWTWIGLNSPSPVSHCVDPECKYKGAVFSESTIDLFARHASRSRHGE